MQTPCKGQKLLGESVSGLPVTPGLSLQEGGCQLWQKKSFLLTSLTKRKPSACMLSPLAHVLRQDAKLMSGTLIQ